MVDDPAAALIAVVNGFGAVAVGVEQKGAVVVVRILRPEPGGAVVPVTDLGAGAPERVDQLTRGCHEADVQPAGSRVVEVGGGDDEVAPARGRPGRRARLDPQCAEHGDVEALGGLVIADPYRQVVEHGALKI